MKEIRYIILLFQMLLAIAHPSAGTAAEPLETPADVQRLLGDLKQDDWILQAATLKRLGELKQTEAAAPILDILQTSSNDWIRGQALVGLAKIKPKEVFSRVGLLTQNRDPEVRIMALRALEYCREPEGLSAVKGVMNDADNRVRWSALAALAAIEGAGAWASIEPALKALAAPEEDAAAREIGRALAYTGNPAAWEWIDKFLDRHTKDDRIPSLIRGLNDVHDPRIISRMVHIMQVVRADPVSVKLSQRALRKYAKTELSVAMSQIIQTTITNDLSAAVQVAGTLCPSPELGELIAGKISREPDMNPAIMGVCLDALSNPEMLPARYQALYQQCLAVKDPVIRRAAVRALEKCDNADLFEILGPSLRDEKPEVRRAALAVLGALPQTRAPVDIAGYIQKFLINELSGSNADLRAEVVRAMAGVCDVRRQVEIARPQGYITDWMVLGAFPSDEKNAGFNQKYPPEDKIDFAQSFKTQYGWTGEGSDPKELLEREIKWQRSSLVLADGMLSLGYIMPPAKYGICYAVADLKTEKAMTVQATLTVDNCAVLWLNGRQLARLEPAVPPEKPVVMQEVKLPLVAGINRIMIKIGNLGDDWSIGIRFHEESGEAVVLPSGFAQEQKATE